jgi:hypothetical protein
MQAQINAELRDLEQNIERADEALRFTGGIPVGPMRSSTSYILETLRRLPPGTLRREGSNVEFIPAQPVMTDAQRMRSFRIRARAILALAD